MTKMRKSLMIAFSIVMITGCIEEFRVSTGYPENVYLPADGGTEIIESCCFASFDLCKKVNGKYKVVGKVLEATTNGDPVLAIKVQYDWLTVVFDTITPKIYLEAQPNTAQKARELYLYAHSGVPNGYEMIKIVQNGL